MARARKARVTDVEQLALGLPEVTRDPADTSAPGRPAYQVRGKTFVFFRGPRKDALDPTTGEPYDDVMAFSCTAEDKAAMVGDADSPFFTTPHWNGYNAVLLLERDIGADHPRRAARGRHRRLAGQGAQTSGGRVPRRPRSVMTVRREYPHGV